MALKGKYRQEMFFAFTSVAALFVALPLAITALVGGSLFGALELTTSLLVPLYATGLFMAPWAGRHVATNKAPAFLMAAVAALSPTGVWLLASLLSGETTGLLESFILYGFFAVPASILGALLFIGGCQRADAAAA